ncbi:MAG: hypothetical protein AMXMBFR33_53800 [Candidatus Xenobia bacterium]|jgi:hypothetical protein
MEIEWLILADAAEVVGNKLYLLGGGWDRLTVHAGFPLEQHCAVAASVRVPWHETEITHEFTIEFITEDGQVLESLGAEFEVGRPPGLTPGREQRWQFSGDFDLRLDVPGRYAVVGLLEGEERARLYFEVVSGVRAADLPEVS